MSPDQNHIVIEHEKMRKFPNFVKNATSNRRGNDVITAIELKMLTLFYEYHFLTVLDNNVLQQMVNHDKIYK